MTEERPTLFRHTLILGDSGVTVCHSYHYSAVGHHCLHGNRDRCQEYIKICVHLVSENDWLGFCRHLPALSPYGSHSLQSFWGWWWGSLSPKGAAAGRYDSHHPPGNNRWHTSVTLVLLLWHCPYILIQCFCCCRKCVSEMFKWSFITQLSWLTTVITKSNWNVCLCASQQVFQ